MSPLDRKLLRDLWRIKGQAIAIAVVISLGVLMLVMMDGLVNSLQETRRAYYERYRLADIFAPVKRAPNHIIREISQVPGVSAAEGRINGGALIDLPGIAAPIRAQAVSINVSGERSAEILADCGYPPGGLNVVPCSIEDAVRTVLARAASTISDIHHFEIVKVGGEVDSSGAPTVFTVTLDITFGIKDPVEHG